MTNGNKPQPASQDVAALVAYIERLLASEEPADGRKGAANAAGQKAKEAR